MSLQEKEGLVLLEHAHLQCRNCPLLYRIPDQVLRPDLCHLAPRHPAHHRLVDHGHRPVLRPVLDGGRLDAMHKFMNLESSNAAVCEGARLGTNERNQYNQLQLGDAGSSCVRCAANRRREAIKTRGPITTFATRTATRTGWRRPVCESSASSPVRRRQMGPATPRRYLSRCLVRWAILPGGALGERVAEPGSTCSEGAKRRVLVLLQARGVIR